MRKGGIVTLLVLKVPTRPSSQGSEQCISGGLMQRERGGKEREREGEGKRERGGGKEREKGLVRGILCFV